jgi:hypothetical protein
MVPSTGGISTQSPIASIPRSTGPLELGRCVHECPEESGTSDSWSCSSSSPGGWLGNTGLTASFSLPSVRRGS